MRWRPEGMGNFDLNLNGSNIYTFAGCIREVAEIRHPRLVQLNVVVSLQLWEKASLAGRAPALGTP